MCLESISILFGATFLNLFSIPKRLCLFPFLFQQTEESVNAEWETTSQRRMRDLRRRVEEEWRGLSLRLLGIMSSRLYYLLKDN
jgi:hypothetical protein